MCEQGLREEKQKNCSTREGGCLPYEWVAPVGVAQHPRGQVLRLDERHCEFLSLVFVLHGEPQASHVIIRVLVVVVHVRHLVQGGVYGAQSISA